MRQPENARRVGIQTGVQRRATRTALRRGAEAVREPHAARRQAVQGRRRNGRLPVAAEVLPEIVTGKKEDVARQAALSP